MAENRKKPVSSIDLARICNVSQGTVDRALHGRGRISEVTRNRILKAAKTHGYVPNPVAHELLTGSSPFVAAIIPALSAVFFGDLMEALSNALKPHGLRLLLSPADTATGAHELLHEFGSRRVRGTVIFPPEDNFSIDPPLLRMQPVVAIVNPCFPPSVPFIGPDEVETGKNAVAFLAAKGHRRILHFSYEHRSWAIVTRENGYTSAMKRLGQKACIVQKKTDEAQLIRAIRSYKPTAIFCHNDWLALTAIRLLSEEGIKVPEEISIMGVDNSPTFNSLYNGLTTMHYPITEIAERVVSNILGKSEKKRHLSCSVVERDTVKRFS